MSENAIEINDVCKQYIVDNKKHTVLNNLNMVIQENKFVSILGYTGCGKTTLLRIVCGLENPDSGTVKVLGRKHLTPTKDVVLIYQDLNQLFPWKTAIANLIYVIQRSENKCNRQEAEKKARELLRAVGLEEFANYYPHQMSGGMRQRCAVARAIAMAPKILLMDEPFSALDEVNRRKLQTLCRTLFEETKITVLFVTHSIEEAITLSDRIIIVGNKSGNIVTELENSYRNDQKEEERVNMRAKILSFLNAEYAET